VQRHLHLPRRPHAVVRRGSWWRPPPPGSARWWSSPATGGVNARVYCTRARRR